MYIKMNTGHHFGVSCIVGSFMDKDDFDLDNWSSQKERLKRQFTVLCQEQCELLTLSISRINMMKNEFKEAYQELFNNSYHNLRNTI